MRSKVITVFVIVWLIIFHYESLRGMVLNPLLKRDLPKIKFLFPPAGWIMFYAVDDSYSYVQVTAFRNGQAWNIDPHDILQTRPIGYDNVRRNALISVIDPALRAPFCGVLKRKFPGNDYFEVAFIAYPSLSKNKFYREVRGGYVCRD